MTDTTTTTEQSPNQTDLQSLPTPATMADTDTDTSPPQPTPPKHSTAPFSIWPPTDRTRDAVRNRLIETLSSPSILSKRYGTVSRDEALEAAKLIEEEAFDAAAKSASNVDDDGIEILQVYSKEISKRMLDTVKSRSGATAGAAAPSKAEEEDAGSNAPPQSEKTESVAGDE